MNRQKRIKRAATKKKQANVEYRRNRFNKKNGKNFCIDDVYFRHRVRDGKNLGRSGG